MCVCVCVCHLTILPQNRRKQHTCHQHVLLFICTPYEEVSGALSPPLSCKKLVQMDQTLKPVFEGMQLRCRPYSAPQEEVKKIKHQIQECILVDAQPQFYLIISPSNRPY